MSQHDRIDPQSLIPLTALLEALPGGFNAIPDIGARRSTLYGMLEAMSAGVPPNENVTKDDRVIDGPGGDLTVRVYRPTSASGVLPGLFFIHGGGMVLGNLDSDDGVPTMLCETLGAVVVSVDYRLAPEHPAPAAIEDCYAAIQWMGSHADELGYDPARLAVYGGSAGGGLAIATALKVRDQGGPSIGFLMPIYPMIDDTNTTPSSQEITEVGIWDRDGNIESWAWYLGGKPADQYSAPARATDLTGLPPTFIDVGEMDLFRDEDITFAQRLLQAGVPTELHVYPGAYHASEIFAPDAALSQRIWATRIAALQRALSSPQP